MRKKQTQRSGKHASPPSSGQSRGFEAEIPFRKGGEILQVLMEEHGVSMVVEESGAQCIYYADPKGEAGRLVLTLAEKERLYTQHGAPERLTDKQRRTFQRISRERIRAQALQESAQDKLPASENGQAPAQPFAVAGAGGVDIERLADRITQAVGDSPKWPQDSMRRVWYMLNIANPVIEKLLERYRLSIGARQGCPITDRERLVFELKLMRPSVLSVVAAAVKQIEEDNAHENAGQKENG